MFVIFESNDLHPFSQKMPLPVIHENVNIYNKYFYTIFCTSHRHSSHICWTFCEEKTFIYFLPFLYTFSLCDRLSLFSHLSEESVIQHYTVFIIFNIQYDHLHGGGFKVQWGFFIDQMWLFSSSTQSDCETVKANWNLKSI